MVAKRELSNTAKLSVFKLIFVPILTCGRESWVTTQRMSSQVQVAEMGFCEDLTAWHFAAMCAAVNFAEPWISSYVGSAMCPECPGAVWQGKSCWLHPRERGPVVDHGPGGVTTSPTSRPQWLHLQGKATTKIGCFKCALGKVAACWLFPIPSPPWATWCLRAVVLYSATHGGGVATSGGF